LEAEVYLRADEDLRAVLNRYRAQLKELFITSGVQIGSRDGAVSREFADSQLKLDGVPIAGLQIEATRAPGIKCQRCWCYFDDGGHPELDARCRLVVGANV
jgi:isoleucyl-tRNA synthetase